MIKQNRTASLHKCQFSWHCDGKTDVPHNRSAWEKSLRLSSAVLNKGSVILDPTDGALWYHSDSVSPYWAASLQVSEVVGNHIFYRDRDNSRYAKPSTKVAFFNPVLRSKL